MRLALVVLTTLAAPLISRTAVRPASPTNVAAAAMHQPIVDSTQPRIISASALRAANARQLPTWAAPWNAQLRRTPSNRTALFAVATAERLSYRIRRADSLYLRVAQTGRDHLSRQASLWHAHVVANGGHYINADSLFRLVEKTSRLASDTLTALDAIVAYSGTTTRMVGANAGLAALASGDSLNWMRDPALDGAQRCRQSTIYSRLGNRERARATAREGIAIANRAGLERLEAACQFTLATEFARTGLTDSLRGPLLQAMETQARIDDMAGLAASKQWGGYYIMNLGKVPEAQAYLDVAWNASQRASTTNTSAWIAINRAAIAQSFFDAAGTTVWLRRADSLMRSVDDLQGMIELAKMQVINAQRAGDYASAERYLREARAGAEKLGEPSISFSITSVEWEYAMSRGNVEAAAASTAERRQLIDKYKLTGWNSEVASDEIEILLRRGQGEKAMPLIDRVAGALHPSQRLYQYTLSHERALAVAQQGNAKAAAKAALAAAEHFDQWRATLNDEALRTLSFQSQRRVGWTNSTLTAYLANNGETEVAFLLAERKRARELRDRLARAAALNAATGTARDSSVQTVMTLAEIRRAIPDNRTALVMMDAGDDGVRGTAFVLTRESLTAHSIASNDEVAPRIRRLVASLEAGRDAAAESRALGALLIAPILPRLDSARVSRVVFLPEGALHRLPFDVLMLPDGRYVVERFETAVAPSATILAKLGSEGSPVGLRNLAVADAVVARDRRSDSAPDSRVLLSLFNTSALLPRLGGARSEVASVRQLLPATDVRTGSAATESEVKRTAGSYNVLHFATHAIVDEWSGASAALALSAGGGEDGMLNSTEIARLRLSASLVVLSACRTVGGEIIGGEGVRGLTTAFIQAGARSVVATAWRVNDREVVPVITGMYEQLARRRGVGEALREAKLAAIRRKVAPSVWGAFTLVGDPWRTVAAANP